MVKASSLKKFYFIFFLIFKENMVKLIKKSNLRFIINVMHSEHAFIRAQNALSLMQRKILLLICYLPNKNFFLLTKKGIINTPEDDGVNFNKSFFRYIKNAYQKFFFYL